MELERKEGNDNQSNKNEVKVDRYEHDMKLARALKPSSGRHHAGGGVSPTHHHGKETSNDDAHLGLRGLDEADLLRERGELEAALKLYELSLELLIRVLGSNHQNGDMVAHDNTTTLDRETLKARTQVGLSSAESVKALLKNKPTQRPSEPSREQRSPKQPTKAYKTLSSSLKTRLSSTPPTTKGGAKVKATTRIRPSNNNAARQNNLTQALAADAGNNQIRQAVLAELYVPPSALQKTTWDDIAGLKDTKQSLQEAAILPLMRPDLFTGLRRPQNVLLWGPPGTGKTMLVRAVAHESGSNLFVCTASAMTSKWMGEAEKLVKALFQVARELAPSIIFLDEMDSLLSSRKSEGEHEASRRLKTEFMVQMDGIITKNNNTGSDQAAHVLVIACTNIPWDVDSAVLRRFPRRLLVPLPDQEARKGLLTHLLKKAGKHSISGRQLSLIAQRTDGFSCSDITAIASEASFGPLRSIGDGGMQAIRNVREKDVRPVNYDDFQQAIIRATKSVGPDQLRHYKEWQDQQGAS